MVLRRCRKLLRDEARAVDAMHDVFVLMLRNQHLDGGSSLLFRLATNVCLNQLRAVRCKPDYANAADKARVDSELAADETLRARLKELAADDAATLAAYSPRQVAARVTRSVDSAPQKSSPLRWMVPAFALAAAVAVGIVVTRPPP